MEVTLEAAVPYCGIFGACYKGDFKLGADGCAGGVTGVDNKCRPIDYPFGNVGMCPYVTSCLVEKVAAEHRVMIETTLVDDGVTVGMVTEEGTVTDVVEEEEGKILFTFRFVQVFRFVQIFDSNNVGREEVA